MMFEFQEPNHLRATYNLNALQDEQILPRLQDLIDLNNRTETTPSLTGLGGLLHFQNDVEVEPLNFIHNQAGSLSQAAYPTLHSNFNVITDKFGWIQSNLPLGSVEFGCLKPDNLAEQSPTGSSSSKEKYSSKSTDKQTSLARDKKSLAKQRYREKNRKAQARHRERNKRTIEDLTAKVSSLTAENASLKLEMAIISTLSKAKDDHYSKIRKIKENLSIVEAESLIEESFKLATGTEACASQIDSWCLNDCIVSRKQSVEKMANLLLDDSLEDITSPSFHTLQEHLALKRQLGLRFAVGKPQFIRSLYSWERNYCQQLKQPVFQDLWRSALAVMKLTSTQKIQTVRARAVLLHKMRTILVERCNLVKAAAAGATEGVAEVLAGSLEEERQAVFGFLFSFFDEVVTGLQECKCDVEIFPWAPDVLAMADILTEEVSTDLGMEGLEVPGHLIPTQEGRANIDVLLEPAQQQLQSFVEPSEVATLAAEVRVVWPPETPFQLLSIPFTTSSCGTAGIALLSEISSFAIPELDPNAMEGMHARSCVDLEGLYLQGTY